MIQMTTLDNGIRVVTEKMTGSRALAIGVLVDSSQHHEQAAKAGLAHLVEHALFHGTSERSSLDIAKIIDTVGGRVSAFTSRDYTCFCGMVMDDHRTYLLDLFSDILLNSVFPEDRLEHEKNVVLHEQEMAHDIPYEEVGRLLKENVWPGHALGRPIEGYAETVSSLTREDIIYHLHNTYLPDKIIIAIAGNLDHADIVAQVQDCFWRFTGMSEELKQAAPLFSPCLITKQMAHAQSYFSVAIPAPEYTSSDRYEMHQLSTILGGGLSSRLFRSLREERGLVYDIQSEYHAYRDAGLLVVSGNTSPENQQEAVERACKEIENLFSGQQQLTQEEIWQASLHNIGQHHIDSEDPYNRMSRLLTQLFYFKTVLPTEEIIHQLSQVTKKSLQKTCSAIFPHITDNMGIVLCEGKL